MQAVSCSASATQNITCHLLAPVIAGDAIFVVGDTVCGAGCFETLSLQRLGIENTYHSSRFRENSPQTPTADAVALNAKAGPVDVTLTVSIPGSGNNDSTNLYVVEVRNINGVDAHSALIAPVWSGTTSLSAVTTAHANDVIISTAQTFFTPANTFTAGTGYQLVGPQLNTVSGGVSGFDDMMVQVTNVQTTGTYTPTATATQSPSGGGAGTAFTVALQYAGPITAAPPYFRFQTVNDQVTQGWFPDPTGQSGKCLSNNGTQTNGTLNWISCGGGTVTSVSGTTNQIDVATGTTNPVISLDGQFTSVNYATCTNTADALTVTLSPAPTSLVNGLTVQCRSSAANTTTMPTLSVNGLTAHTIVKGGSSGQQPLVANDILTNMAARFTYNATASTWELQNPQQLAAGSGTVTSIATTAPIGGGTITTTGTITCTTCVVASSPGAGIARFAGSTRAIPSAELSSTRSRPRAAM